MRDPVAIAVLAAAVSLAGASAPSFWFDEAATISAANNRSLPDMMRMLGNIDAVHGLYYFVMRGWFAIAPATEFWARASSGLAVAVAAAGVVVLARQFTTPAVALCAGVAFAVLPRITWAGMETRSYALSAAAAVWVTILFVTAARRGRTRLWLLYAPALALSAVLNVYLVLLVLVHGALVRMLAHRRVAVIWWGATSFTALLAVIPFMVFGHGQIFQVGWISSIGSHTIIDVAVDQYFDDSVPFAVVAGLIIGAAVLIWAGGTEPPDNGKRVLVIVAVVWMAVPTGVILVYSAAFDPIYYPRYLTFTAPAMALVLGVCIVMIAKTRAHVIGVFVVLAVAAAPNYLFVQRGPYAKEGMDYSQVADLIAARAAPGDCLVMDNTTTWKPGPIRPLIAARPSAFEKLVDPGRDPTAAPRGALWDGHIAIWVVWGRLRECKVVWTVTGRDPTLPAHESGANLAPGPSFGDAPASRIPRWMGFRLVERWQFNLAQVIKSTR